MGPRCIIVHLGFSIHLRDVARVGWLVTFYTIARSMAQVCDMPSKYAVRQHSRLSSTVDYLSRKTHCLERTEVKVQQGGGRQREEYKTDTLENTRRA